MKLAAMSTRDRRALILGAIIAIPGVLVPLVVKPYLHALSTVREQTANEHDRLAKEQRAIAELPTLPAIRARASQRLGSEINRLFQASDELVATGDLAQYIASVAQDNGLRLQHSETHPSHPVVSGVQALQVDVRAEGDMEGILHFLHQLESGNKLVRVGTISIETGERHGSSPERPGGGDNLASLLRGLGVGGERRRRGMGMNGGQTQGQAQDTNQLQERSPARSLDKSQLQGEVEVLALSASVYGYRLDTPPWSSADTRRKGAPSPFPRVAYEFESLDAVVDHDPFSATRSRPTMPYRVAMAGDGADAQQSSEQLRQIKERDLRIGERLIQVIGTVMSTDHDSFAMIRNRGDNDTPPRLLHVGEHYGGFTVVALHPGGVVFTTPHGDRFEKQLLEPGSSQ